jgi:4,5-dihydroxyphthalate decarboxylase
MTMRLRTLLGDHPGTSALKDGSLRSDLVALDFAA